jgi:hypothetical protein
MAILLNDSDNVYKYVLNWNPTTTNLELLKYGLTTFDYPSGQYLKTLLDTTIVGGSSFGSPIYGSWYDTTNQSATIAGTATPMYCDSGSGNGITKVADKDFQVSYSGTYNIQFSVQLDESSGAGEHIYIWFRKNDIDIPYSASEVAIQGSLAESIPSWNFIVDMNAGDHLNIMYSVTDTRVYLKSVTPNSIPGIPSVIVTMWKL